MTHLQLNARLDDYLDGDLSAAARAEVEGHLADCPACRQQLAVMRTLATEVAGLAREVVPPRDLWPAIESRLTGGSDAVTARPGASRRGWMAGLAVAAAVLLLVMLRSPGSSAPTADSASTVTAAAASRAGDDLRAAEQEYLAAAAKLTAALEQSRSLLPDDTRAVIDQNLAVIDGALAETRAALERDPRNLRVALMFTTLQQDRVALLRAANRIAGFGEKG